MSSMYTVKFKKKDQWFFRTLKNVKGDFIATDVPGSPRVFILEDESRVEIPVVDTEFKFDVGRFLSIKKQMETEAGQILPVKED